MSTDLTGLITAHPYDSPCGCLCGWRARGVGATFPDEHRAHLAAVIESSDWAREVAAGAVGAAADEFAEGAWEAAYMTGDVEDDESAVRATDAWLHDRARAIREGADDGE